MGAVGAGLGGGRQQLTRRTLHRLQQAYGAHEEPQSPPQPPHAERLAGDGEGQEGSRWASSPFVLASSAAVEDRGSGEGAGESRSKGGSSEGLPTPLLCAPEMSLEWAILSSTESGSGSSEQPSLLISARLPPLPPSLHRPRTPPYATDYSAAFELSPLWGQASSCQWASPGDEAGAGPDTFKLSPKPLSAPGTCPGTGRETGSGGGAEVGAGVVLAPALSLPGTGAARTTAGPPPTAVAAGIISAAEASVAGREPQAPPPAAVAAGAGAAASLLEPQQGRRSYLAAATVTLVATKPPPSITSNSSLSAASCAGTAPPSPPQANPAPEPHHVSPTAADSSWRIGGGLVERQEEEEEGGVGVLLLPPVSAGTGLGDQPAQRLTTTPSARLLSPSRSEGVAPAPGPGTSASGTSGVLPYSHMHHPHHRPAALPTSGPGSGPAPLAHLPPPPQANASEGRPRPHLCSSWYPIHIPAYAPHGGQQPQAQPLSQPRSPPAPLPYPHSRPHFQNIDLTLLVQPGEALAGGTVGGAGAGSDAMTDTSSHFGSMPSSKAGSMDLSSSDEKVCGCGRGV